MQSQLIAGRYNVLRAIGHGGMGTVWLCRDEVLGREVAVKQIGAISGDSATETKRAMREARSAAALNHPNAVAVYDVVDDDGRPWLVMEYVEGETLADEISRDGHISPQRVADIGAQLAGALARAHERGIVHRDIKPGNVLMDKTGRPKISDFGIARGHGDEQLTQVGFITGTPGFLSPELARGGDPLPASDVWALGATLYNAVEGQSPYASRSNPIAMLRAIATERPRPMTHAGSLGPAIDAMMDEDPAQRWDMATCAKRLGGIARITSIMPRPDPARTAVIVAPAVEPTQRLEVTQPVEANRRPETTQRLDVSPPAMTAPMAPTLAAKGRVAQPAAHSHVTPAPVAPEPEAPAPVAPAPVAPAPVAFAPLLKASAAPVEALAANSPKPRGLGARQSDPPPPPSNDRTGLRRWLPLVIVALLVAVLGGTFLASQLGAKSGTNAGPTIRPTAAASKTSAPTAAASKTSAPTAAASKTSAPTAAASITATVVPAPQAAKKLESFVKSYYSDVTKSTDRTWGLLTPTMQQTALGRAGYDGFWSTIAKVKVNTTQPDVAATSADVNLTFIRTDGTTSTETHRLTFVPQGSSYLIESDKLL